MNFRFGEHVLSGDDEFSVLEFSDYFPSVFDEGSSSSSRMILLSNVCSCEWLLILDRWWWARAWRSCSTVAALPNVCLICSIF